MSLIKNRNKKESLIEFLVEVDLIRETAFFLIPATTVKVASIDISTKNSMYNRNNLLRIVDKLDVKPTNEAYARNFEIISTSKLLTEASVEYLREALPALNNPGLSSIQLKAVRSLIEDEKLMKKLGKPLELKSVMVEARVNAVDSCIMTVEGKSSCFNCLHSHLQKLQYKNSNKKGQKEKAELRIFSEQNEIKLAYLTYHVKYKDLVTYSDVSKLAVNGLLSQNPSCYMNLGQVFIDINLEGIIEKKLLRSTRLMSSIGSQYRLGMDKADVKRLLNGTGEDVVVRFRIKGKLNKAELVVSVSRKETSEKWIVQNSSVKILWNT